MTTELLASIEVETGNDPTHSIIWLHGLGADGNDFVSIVDELHLPPEKSIRFIFPHAPQRPVTINGGYIMRAWYDIYHVDFNHRQDDTGIHASQKEIDTLIDRERQRGIITRNIVLAGFSQGGALVLQTGLRQSQPLAGIIALSCYLPLANTLTSEASSANAGIPILMTHGIHDSVIPITYAIASRDKLLTAGYAVEWHEYPMAHSVCSQEIADIGYWLRHIMV